MSWKATIAALLNSALSRYDIKLVRGVDMWHSMTQLGRQPEPQRDGSFAEPFFRTYVGADVEALQTPFDFAVLMPVVLRPTIADAIESVFAQNFRGRVQLVIGIDALKGDAGILDQVCRKLPPHHAVQVFYPGYSTSRRHGGLHPDWCGGAIRTILSYLANSRYVAYLDDDNWYWADHLRSLHEALQGHDWAHSLRWYVHPKSRRPICEDRWESVGPLPHGTAIDPAGWVDPNCLALDKVACEAVLRWWSIPLRNSPLAMDADRNVFNILRTEFRGRSTGQATAFYTINESDRFRHPFRLQMIGADRYAAAGIVQPEEEKAV